MSNDITFTIYLWQLTETIIRMLQHQFTNLYTPAPTKANAIDVIPACRLLIPNMLFL